MNDQNNPNQPNPFGNPPPFPGAPVNIGSTPPSIANPADPTTPVPTWTQPSAPPAGPLLPPQPIASFNPPDQALPSTPQIYSQAANPTPQASAQSWPNNAPTDGPGLGSMGQDISNPLSQ